VTQGARTIFKGGGGKRDKKGEKVSSYKKLSKKDDVIPNKSSPDQFTTQRGKRGAGKELRGKGRKRPFLFILHRLASHAGFEVAIIQSKGRMA